MRRAAAKGQRWQLSCGDDVKRPKKPSHRTQVIEHLGPFKFQTQDEALRHGQSVMLGDQLCGLSRELAQELVEDLAIRFNTEEHLARGAPRFADVLARLKVVRDRAAALADALDSLDDISRYEPLRGDLKAEPDRLLKDTRAHSLYVEWIGQLRKRALYFERVRQHLLERRKKQKRELVDRGGNTNYWKEQMGAPRWSLVTDAIQIFELFKPGEATGTEGGKFHDFVNDLFEYATGLEGTTNAKVDSWVKRLAKPNREERELEAEGKRLDTEWNDLTDQDPNCTDPDVQKRRQEIVVEERRVHQRRKELWDLMWPHAAPRLIRSGE